MPELPDVEVFRRYLVDTVGGREIARCEVLDERCLEGVRTDELEDAVAGGAPGATNRRGKHLFVQLRDDTWLTLHFGMTGYLLFEPSGGTVSAPGGASDTGELRFARVAFHLAGGGTLYYVLRRMLGRVGLTSDPEVFAAEHDLGPDARDLSGDDFMKLLASARGKVKSLLMNQSRLAGIGNIYSDEMLFDAGIHPDAACRRLNAAARRDLDRARNRVLDMAIDRQANPEAMPRTWLLPHREDGAACPRCDGTIRRVVISGRGAYLCDTHQSRFEGT